MTELCVKLPHLAQDMRTAHASNLALAEASGVSERSISNAKAGKWIKREIAECIMLALVLEKFEYKKRGPKNE